MKIADAEWILMRVVWQRGPVGAAEVIEVVLPETGWSHRTVRTLLNRLVKKGALRAEMLEGRNIYRAKVAQSQCMRQESRSFLNKVFSGDAGQMLVHFIQNEKMTPEQIKQLKALLNAKQQGNK
ncbi:MAG TPA: BlaI/MecI/CopY family transcriptional regulator [Planctomycetaceae bacterium]|jgi:BlaI family penicillinase repressor|nr:BlaI/MecI/CopY family transcriptional regulator [Planctomycetaceae bacterium]